MWRRQKHAVVWIFDGQFLCREKTLGEKTRHLYGGSQSKRGQEEITFRVGAADKAGWGITDGSSAQWLSGRVIYHARCQGSQETGPLTVSCLPIPVLPTALLPTGSASKELIKTRPPAVKWGWRKGRSLPTITSNTISGHVSQSCPWPCSPRTRPGSPHPF